MSTKKTVQIQKNETPERHLIDAANILIEGFKEPANLLEFLTRTFIWFEYATEKKDSYPQAKKSTYTSVSMIEKLVQPWLKNDENVVQEISEGIKNIWDLSHYEGYFEYLALIIQGFGIDTYDSPFIPEKAKLYLSAMNTMHEVGFCIEAYEMEINKIREQEKLSEAA
jgi:hypothetical protein